MWKTKRWLLDSTIAKFITVSSLVLVLQAPNVRAGKDRLPNFSRGPTGTGIASVTLRLRIFAHLFYTFRDR